MPRSPLSWILTALLLAPALPSLADPPDAGQPNLCPRCDVVLVLLPGLRADSIAPERMPRLAEWIRTSHAVRFNQAISPSSWYLPATISILTGLLPNQHGVFNEAVFQGGPPPALPGADTLPGLLHGARYRTAAFAATGVDEPRFALDRGFDEFKSFPRDSGLDAMVPEALAWLRQGAARPGEKPQDRQPSMMMLLSFQGQGWRLSAGGREGEAKKWKELRHLTMSQTLFGLDASEAAELRAYHDGLLREEDAQLFRLLSQLPRRALVVVASTNGEEFGEHGGMDHGQTLYDETVHVPLLVALPSDSHWRDQDHQLSLREIGPMILDYVGVRKSLGPETPMFNRVDMVQGNGMDEPVVSQTDFMGLSRLAALRSTDGWKLISDRASGATQLFFVVDDPGEKRDRAAERPDLVRSYSRQLEGLLHPERAP